MTAARILVVEDEAVVALDLRTRLTRLGYEVVGVATTGDEAVAIAQEQRPDLTLMDIRLRSTMDGIEAAEKIRTQVGLPVVYLTAHADEATVDRARVTEPFGYILKPFDERELRTVIETALYKHGAEQRLRESERRYATTLASIGDGVIATDKIGCVTFMNSVAERLSGWRMADAQGVSLTTVFNICNEDTRLPVANPVDRVLLEGVVVGLANHTILKHRDGHEFPIDDCAAPILDDRGQLTGAVLVFRDVTQAKQVEEHMRHAQKMEAVGQLAGGVAHDFNNLLTVILNYSDILLKTAGPDHPWHDFLSEIHQAGERSAELTRHLLTFCRKQLVEPKIFDLNDSVRKIEQMLKRLIGENFEFRLKLGPNVGPVRMDPGQIDRILVNLVVNARDAISEQGCITIETTNVQVSESQFPNLAAGTYRCIQVSDNGCGIPVAHRDRIFEPFFTTKPQGKGTGLGLASVYGIVNQCGGHIAFKTELGHGTTFCVYIPAVNATVEQDNAFKDLQLTMGSETVLLVEDEAAVRSLSRHILETCGYTVFEAENGEKAIDIALHHADKIDIIVTDVVMPIMGARIMLEKLRPLIHEMKVLLLSGYGEENLRKDILEYSQAGFLHKPFTVTSLALAVRRVLDGETVT